MKKIEKMENKIKFKYFKEKRIIKVVKDFV